MIVLESLTAFVLGGAAYGALEILWRGRTHWTMLLAGGLCFALMYQIASRSRASRWRQYAMCAAVITAVELVTGSVVNVALGWDVWDYSGVPGNLCGQICPLYSLFWLLLSVPGCGFARLLRRYLFGGGRG